MLPPPPLALRFPLALSLDLRPCCDLLLDPDLCAASSSFTCLETLLLGHPDLPQHLISDHGLASFRLLQHVHLSSLPNLTSDGIALLVWRCPLLRSLSLEDCTRLTDEALQSVSRCQKLEELTLKGDSQFTAKGLSTIGLQCPSLLKIRFEFSSLELRYALKSFASSCPNMREISLKVQSVDYDDLVKCTSLTCLRIETEYRQSSDEAVLKVVEANKNLRELVFISHAAPLSDASVVRAVQSCHSLEKLHLDASNLTETVVLSLMECKTLKSLALHHLRRTGRGLQEAGLCRRADLNELSLRFACELLDQDLEILLQGSKRLEILNLQCCHGLTLIGFSAIACCSNLKSLDLSFTEVDDLSLSTIADAITALEM